MVWQLPAPPLRARVIGAAAAGSAATLVIAIVLARAYPLASGTTSLTYDGDSTTGNINFTGLGGQVLGPATNGRGFRVLVLSFDWPNGINHELVFDVYSSATSCSTGCRIR